MAPGNERTPGDDVQYRFATHADADAIAALHADSWSRHYRGAYSDSYLDRDARQDRLSVWRERFQQVREDRLTVVAVKVVAVKEDGLAGFAHTCLDADPQWGALLDNLHVRSDLKRQGVGRALMAETAAALLERRPASPLYLWVLQQNVAAQAFYVALGGTLGDAQVRGPFPGGGRALAHRVAWPDPRMLLSAPG